MIDQIDEWLQALEIERQEQQHEFLELLLKRTIPERVSNGFTWYPLQVKSHGYAVGAVPFIVIEKSKDTEGEEKFQAGRPVQIFCTSADKDERPIKAIVHWINKRQMKLYLHTNEIPNWIFFSGLGVDLLYDEQTFKDMKNAMLELQRTNTPVLKTLRSLFYDSELEYTSSSQSTTFNFEQTSLNESQIDAINKCVNSSPLHIIHGPPGTGKTTTLVQLIKTIVKEERQILVCAPSNAAVDWITGLIQKEGIRTLRIGHLSRIDQDVIECSLESRVFGRQDAKEIKRLRIKADEYRKMAGTYKRHFGFEERQQRRFLNKEARELSAWATELERRIIYEEIDKAQVITATLTGVNNKYIQDRKFNICIIDEAAQALQGACWIPMLKSKKVILAGDPFQLPPTVKSIEAGKKGLTTTLLDIAIKRSLPLSLLTVQYRMNKSIMEFSNQWFYRGALRAHSTVEDHVIQSNMAHETALEFIDTAGCGFQEKLQKSGKSFYNPDEYRLIREHLDPLIIKYYAQSISVGVLSPYKAQVKYMKELFEEEGLPDCDLTVQTIDGFQGQERDIIYISLTRSNDESIIGFLKDYRRMNVAMTRARKKLIILGDSSTIGADPFYKALLDYIDQQQAYRSAWEFIHSG
jgi:ATP-dependent RNA/DNA helicase IGHMBP2